MYARILGLSCKRAAVFVSACVANCHISHHRIGYAHRQHELCSGYHSIARHSVMQQLNAAMHAIEGHEHCGRLETACYTQMHLHGMHPYGNISSTLVHYRASIAKLLSPQIKQRVFLFHTTIKLACHHARFDPGCRSDRIHWCFGS